MTSVKDALLEIGCEELPASFVPLGMRQLQALAQQTLTERGLVFKAVQVFGTPRRLAVCISELAGHSQDQEKRIYGPAVANAKDAAGQWSPAAMGFARKYGVKPGDLLIEKERLCAVQVTKGERTRALLAELYPSWITRLQFPKTMEWEPTHFRFPRPIRWYAALYGQDLVSFMLAGVRSGRWTYGLSIQSSKKVLVSHAGKYVGLLKNQCVMVDPVARLDAIRKLSEQGARRVHGQVLMRQGLLEEVSYLVEHPVAILGSFDPTYLGLPREVLITCIEHHQKFFPVETTSDEKCLLPNFIGIRNGVSVHQELVKEGYERVLAARLADARFFFNKDRQTPLSQKVDALRGVVFQKDLGSLFDKKERVRSLLEVIAQRLEWNDSERLQAQTAAGLGKADLVTEMVGEFPELQGTMGRIYAQLENLDPVIATALEEHYWPITLTSALPTTPVAAAVALADKLDTLVGDFAVGLIPTGSADPYGLRRAAVGILRILESQGWTIPLEWLVDQALGILPKEVVAHRDTTRQELLQFLRQRFSSVLEERGFHSDEVDAVLTLQFGIVSDALARLNALHAIRSRPEFTPLSMAFKRAMNIVRQANPKETLTAITSGNGNGIRAELLQDPSEQTLYQTFESLHTRVEQDLQAGAYGTALESMVTLRDPLDRFFEGVMVLTDDASLRANRLALLSGIVRLFLRIADFSKLQNA